MCSQVDVTVLPAQAPSGAGDFVRSLIFPALLFGGLFLLSRCPIHTNFARLLVSFFPHLLRNLSDALHLLALGTYRAPLFAVAAVKARAAAWEVGACLGPWICRAPAPVC